MRNLPGNDTERLTRDFSCKGDVESVQAANFLVCLTLHDHAYSAVNHMTTLSNKVWDQEGSGYVGLVKYKTCEQAASALKDWNHSYYRGQQLRIEYARRG